MKARTTTTCVALQMMVLFLGNFTSQGSDLLQSAREGNLPAVKGLIASGIDVESKDKDGFTALTQAAAGGHTAVMEVLLAAKANVNTMSNKSWTPLMVASFMGKI